MCSALDSGNRAYMTAFETSHVAAQAVDDLYRRHAGEVYRYAYAALGHRADAEDVTQTTFLNAYRSLERGVRPRKPSNWLLTIASNLIKQRFRTESAKPRQSLLGEHAAHSDPEDAPTIGELMVALGAIRRSSARRSSSASSRGARMRRSRTSWASRPRRSKRFSSERGDPSPRSSTASSPAPTRSTPSHAPPTGDWVARSADGSGATSRNARTARDTRAFSSGIAAPSGASRSFRFRSSTGLSEASTRRPPLR